MPTDMKRVLVSVPKDLETQLTKVKQQLYFGESWAEMYRILIRKGAQAALQETTKNSPIAGTTGERR
jgi:sulfur transfer protein SufE